MTWSLVFSIIIGLLGIDILIIVHELGHFVMARIFSIYVEKIQIGIGPVIASKTGRTGTQYRLCAVPYGAFCKMDSYSLKSISNAKKILIYLAGPIANILMAITFYTVYLCIINTSFIKAMQLACYQCFDEIRMFYNALGDMITGKAKIGSTISGFINASINIGNITRNGFAAGLLTGVETALWICASVGVSLAFANLLPIPALDGGFIFLIIIESVTGHKFSEEFNIISQLIGLVLILVVIPIVRLFF